LNRNMPQKTSKSVNSVKSYAAANMLLKSSNIYDVNIKGLL